MKKANADISISPVYVVMGVSAVGKTTIAKAIAQKHRCLFLEGDDFHPKKNIEIMSSGRSLNDENRLPWLRELSLAAEAERQRGSVVVTCSALKLSYRDEIRKYIPDVSFIHLHGRFDYIAKQMSQREGHFMPVSLLQSQFDTLQLLGESEQGVTISVENEIEGVLQEFEAFMASNKLSAESKSA